MRHLYLFILIIWTALPSKAQVGVGTTDPKEMLHVIGNVRVEGAGEVLEKGSVFVGADDKGNLTTVSLTDKLVMNNSRLELTTRSTYGIGFMDLSATPYVQSNVNDLDLQLGPGEINQGMTVIKVNNQPSKMFLTGIQDGVNGMHIFIYNLSTANIKFMDNDAASLAQNRINCLAGSFEISGRGSVELVYDGVSQRWLVLSIHD